MKKFTTMLVLVAGMFSLGGCFASNGYSGQENVDRTVRTWDYEAKQAVDDAMYELMLVPPSRSSLWNLR